jgi:hypothetical protein
MKLHQFALVFVIITIAVIIITDVKTNNLKAVVENRNRIDRYLDTAIDDGITRLAEVDENNKIIVNKEAAVNSFFISFHTCFGILSDKEQQEKLNLYIPVVAITMEDGYYVFYSDEYTGIDGYRTSCKRWSEKFPYSYEDDDFIYCFTLGDIVSVYDKNNLLGKEGTQKVYNMNYHDFQTEDLFSAFRNSRPDSILLDNEAYELIRKETIISCIEKTMAYFTSRHNKIAQNYGITYNFSLPVMSEEKWAPYLDDISMFVVFQGYPFGEQEGETYNRIVTAGAKVSKRTVYYIEQKGWYLIYHRENCPELKKQGIILREEIYYDPLQCAQEGCYQCPVCFEHGIYASDYIP